RLLRGRPFFYRPCLSHELRVLLIFPAHNGAETMADASTVADARTTRLQVANARPDDSGHGLARLPKGTMLAIGVVEGDVVEIVGKRSTPARAVTPYAEDEGLDILRLDGLQRANAGVGSGDFVEVRKAESKPAQRVVFAPAQQNLRLQGSGQAL